MTHPATTEDQVLESYMQPIRDGVQHAVAYMARRGEEDKMITDDETMLEVLTEAVTDILAIDGESRIEESLYHEALSTIVGVAGQLLARVARAKVVYPSKTARVN